MTKAVTARSWWKTYCPRSSLSLELSGEAKETRLPPPIQLIPFVSTTKVACKQTLIATPCLLTALLIECAAGIKVTGRFFFFSF